MGSAYVVESAYVHNTVQGQRAAQQIHFPPQAAFAHAKAGTEITPSMIPSLGQTPTITHEVIPATGGDTVKIA